MPGFLRLRSLHRKLLRDLAMLKGQIAAIAVVIAAGVMMLIVSVASLAALSLSQQRFYSSHQFADIFVHLTRAPERVADQVRSIAGVNQVNTRVQAPLRLEVPGYADPVRGLVISIPDGRQPDLNRLHLREGSLPDSGRNDQALISEPFAEAHGLRAGDTLSAIINGRQETLSIAGIALSPEHIYQIGPADLLPDYKRYAILWMNRTALANAFGMDGAFNSIVLSLQAGTAAEPVIEALDLLLTTYGGMGAYERADQVSHRFLEEELTQLRVMAVFMPTVFLGVAAFLLNVLMGRIVRTQQQQVAVLKAFGYSNQDLALHFGMLTGLITLIGTVLGIGLGAWAAEGLAMLYAEYFRFPDLGFRLQAQYIALAVLVAGGATLLGTYRAVRGAVRLPPAQAMRPPAPERFQRSPLEHTWLDRHLDQPSRVILRNLTRHPLKAGLSILGIGLSCALVLLGSNQFASVDYLLDTQYRKVLTMDLHLSFTDPTPARALAELRQLPGVHFAEGYRAVPVRLRNGRTEYRTAILGTDANPQLRKLIDAQGQSQTLPPTGIMLTGYLADYLGVAPGELLEVEIMEGQRRRVWVPVTAHAHEPIGVSAYMERRALNQLLREGPALSGAWLLTDQSQQQALFEALWKMPRVASIGMISEAESSFREYISDTILVFMMVLLLLAGSITVAVVYNNARIAFTERSRELATLRVLGFTRGEVAWILLGELLLLTLLAIPVGLLTGAGLAYLLSLALTMDLYRFPFVLSASTFAYAAASVLAATALALTLIARRLHQLDMVSALKTVE